MVNKTWSEHFQWCLMVSLDRHKEGVSKATTNFVPFPRIPSLLRLCDYVQRMITTRIIAALKTPSAGLLTIVGALLLLYTNPGHTQTYPSPLGQTTFQGLSRPAENIRNQGLKFFYTPGRVKSRLKSLLWVDDGLVHLGASPLLCAALRDQAMKEGRVKTAHPSLKTSFSHSADNPCLLQELFRPAARKPMAFAPVVNHR